MEKYGTARQATENNIIRCLRFTRRISEETDTHSEYVILTAIPRQQWLRERISMLRLYVHSLSCDLIIFRRSLTMEHFSRLDCVVVELLSTVETVMFDILVPIDRKLRQYRDVTLTYSFDQLLRLKKTDTEENTKIFSNITVQAY